MRFGVVIGFAALAVATALAAWLGTELVMAPSGSERTGLIAMYAAISCAVFVLAMSLIVATRRSLNRRILALGVGGPLVVGVVTIIGAWSMFISTHDTQFVVILAAAATVLAAGLVHLLVHPLRRDLERIAEAAELVGQGDLTVRTELERPDELGDVARAFDAMAARLEVAATTRDRMEAERRFMLSSLSHDARTPLTAIRAAVEALQDGMAPDPDRYLDSIERDLSAIESIVENLFVLARLDAAQLEPRLEPVDLREVAAHAVAAIEPLASKHETNLCFEAPEPVAAQADPTETGRMISNLLTNAIRHSPRHGSVRVVVSDEPTPSVTVIDEGPGLRAEFIDTAFDEFTRADAARDRAHGGAGLGLAVVRGLAEAQGGEAWAEPGPGGRVGFRLPAL